MKKHLLLFASLVLGFMVTSCQNDLEEVLESSAVQEEFATTRAEGNNTSKIVVTSIPSNELDEDALPSRATYIAGPSITSDATYPNIIGGTEQITYSFTSAVPGDVTSIQWVYSSGIFTEVNTTLTGIKLRLTNPSSTTDGTLTAYLYVGSVAKYISTMNIGVNGPRSGSAGSLTIIRTSDSVQVYPFSSGAPFSPYTYYYATFSSSYPLSLNWDFGGHATILSQYGQNCHFQTDNQQWWLLNVKGTMYPYNVEKTLLTAWLYGQ